MRDKSSRVRRKAADWAGRLRCTALLPALQHALSVEQNVENQHVMHYEIDRLNGLSIS